MRNILIAAIIILAIIATLFILPFAILFFSFVFGTDRYEDGSLRECTACRGAEMVTNSIKGLTECDGCKYGKERKQMLEKRR